jgi:hypothetical protein
MADKALAIRCSECHHSAFTVLPHGHGWRCAYCYSERIEFWEVPAQEEENRD